MPDNYFNSLKPRQGDESINILPPIIVFDVLQILGLVSISAILCTVWFSSGIRRSIGWFSFTFSWGLTCIGHLAFLRHQTGLFPGSVLCLWSAMLTYACPPLNALTFAVFVLEIFFSLSSISRTTMMALYLVPYGVFAGILIMVFTLGRLNPTAVLRAPLGIFCHMSIRVPKYLSWTIVICSLTASLILGVRVTLKCRRQLSLSKRLLSHNGTTFGLVLRVGLIGAFSILSIGLAVISMFSWDKIFTVCLYIVPAAFPAIVGIIFGSQEDILCVWMFWRKRPQPLATTSVRLSTSSESSTSVKNEP